MWIFYFFNDIYIYICLNFNSADIMSSFVWFFLRMNNTFFKPTNTKFKPFLNKRLAAPSSLVMLF